jgi:hypothetical protein
MTPLPTRFRFLLVGFVAFATLTAACGDDSAAENDAADPEATAEGDVANNEGTVAPDEQTSDDATTTTSVPVELSDSFRGVTSTAIKVGVAGPDLEALRGLIDLDHGSYEAAYRALITEVNADGGVLGRNIEIVFESYLPIGTEGMDTICSRFTDDEEVFAVMGGLLDDGPLCYTQLTDTALIGSTQNNRRVAVSTAPWFTGVRNSDDVMETIIRGFDREGIFEGRTVGVVAAVADRNEVEAGAIPLLAELGVDVADISYIEASPIDTVAADTEVALIAEKQEVSGVDLALAIGGATPQYAGGLEQATFRPRLATTSLASLRAYIRDRGGRDLSVLDESVAGNTAEQLGWWDDPAIQECIAVVEAAGEPSILDPNTRLAEEPENLVSVAAACRDVALFVEIATAAGPDLTNDSFQAAGNALGDFHVPGFGPGNFSAESPDSSVPVYFYEWDDEVQDLRSDGTTL